MSLWKRIKDNRVEKTVKAREQQSSKVRPESVLIWIDAACNDHSARVVRGLAIAEAFRSKGIEKITLACLQSRNLLSEANDRNVYWLDSRPNGNPITFNEIVKTSKADLVIADSSVAPRLQSDLPVPLFVLLADVFSPSLLETDSIRVVLLPGLISPPDFEILRILPSRIGNCIHGMDYVPIPNSYFTDEIPNSQEDRVLAVLSGTMTPESFTSLLQTVKQSWSGGIVILADTPAESVQKIQEMTDESIEWLIAPSLRERVDAIRRAVVALAYPALNVYELLALRKPVLLMPRNEEEIRICRIALEQNVARVVPTSESMETLSLCFNELLKNRESRKFLSEQTKNWMPVHGARDMADALLARYERIAGRS